ncbi:MAG: hypothetical protein IJ435_09640 [Clostridia bacterium]|nr:hypothetical protein [Clostridia bacterium]
MKKNSPTEIILEGTFDENTTCFFIVEKRHRKAFIKNLAYKLMRSGCRQFEFYGKYSEKWQDIFIDADIEINPLPDINTIALVLAWEDKADFWDSVEFNNRKRAHFFFDTMKALKMKAPDK